jgi:hypothetical protein
MSEPYTLLDAMREEIDTIKELETIYEKQEKFLLLSDYQRQRRSLERIVNRFEKGFEYYMGIDSEGNAQLKYRQTDKHLLREYPALQAAKENYDVVKNMVK